MPYDALGNYYPGDEGDVAPGVSADTLAQWAARKVMGPNKRPGDSRPDLPDLTSEALLNREALEENAANTARNENIMLSSLGQLPSAVVATVDTLDRRIPDAVQGAINAPAGERGRAALKGFIGEEDAVRRGVRQYDEAVNDFVGAPQEEDRTTGEKVLAAVTQALVPVPKVPGIGRAGNLATDLLAPGTTTLTPTGFAVNAGLAGGITAATDKYLAPAIKEAFNPPGYSEDNDYTSDQPDALTVSSDIARTDWALGSFATLAAAAAAGMSTAGRKAAEEATKAAADSARGFVRGGAQAEREAGNTLAQRAANAVDELAPVQRAITEATESADRGRAFLRENSYYWGSNRHETFGYWNGTGKMPNSEIKTASGKELYAARDALAQSGQLFGEEGYEFYRLARTQFDARRNVLRTTEKALDDLRDVKNKQINDGDWKGVYETDQKISEQAKRFDDLLEDVNPVVRQGMSDYSTKKLEESSNVGAQNPVFKKVDELLDSVFDGVNEHMIEQGLITHDAVIDRVLKNPNYTPIQIDPHGGKSGLGRVTSVLRDKLGIKENPRGDPDGVFARGFGMGREYADDIEKKANALVNPFDAAHAYMERYINFSQKNAAKRNLVDEILSGPKAEDVVTRVEINGRSAFSPEEAQLYKQKGWINPDGVVDVWRNGKLEFYRFRDADVAEVMRQDAAASLPIFRETTRWFKQFTTGKFRPGFAPTNLAYDTRAIEASRKLDTVNGADYLAYKAAKLFVAPETARSIAKGVNVVTKATVGVYDPTAYILNVGRAVELWGVQNKQSIAQKIIRDLDSDRGFFNTLLKDTSAQDMAKRWAENSVDAFMDGIHANVAETHIASIAALEQNTRNIRDADKFITMKFSGKTATVLDFASTPATAALQGYKNMLSSIHSAARVGFYARNIEMLIDEFGSYDKIPNDKLKALQGDARTIAGDFSRKPGSKVLQRTDSAVPYFNVMLRTTQQMWQRAKEDPTVAAQMIYGAMMPSIASAIYMNNHSKESYDYYNRQMPTWQRVGTVITPSFELMWEYLKGNNPKFDPARHYHTTILPEMRPLAEAGVRAMQGLGLFGTKYDGNTSAEVLMSKYAKGSPFESILEGVKQAYGVQLPPALAGIFAATGQKIEPMNVIMGKNPVEQIDKSSSGPARAGLGGGVNINSEIPQAFGAVMGTVLGVNGKNLVESFASAEQAKGEGFGRAVEMVKKGAKELYERNRYDIKEPAPLISDLLPDAPLFGRPTEKVYRGMTPDSEFSGKARAALTLASGRRQKAGPVMETASPAVNVASEMLRSYYNSPQYKDGAAKYKGQSEALARIDANRELSYPERLKERNRIIKEMVAHNASQATWFAKIESTVASGPAGARWQQEFGEPFSLENYEKRAAQGALKEKNRRILSPPAPVPVAGVVGASGASRYPR